MKQKDIALIVTVALVSVIVSVFTSNILFAGSGAGKQEAEVVDAISAEFLQPDKRYFNEESVDPTLTIRIGDNSNETPFKQPE